MAWRKFLFRIAALLLLGTTVFVGACQSRQAVQLSDGLLKNSDLAGQWQWSDTSLNLVTPGYSRYKDIPVTEIAESLLKGRYTSDEYYVKIFHLLLHCKHNCPPLGALDLTNDLAEAGGGETFSPNLLHPERFTDAQCLRTKDSIPVTVCAVEVRYAHILSRLTLYINGGISNEEVEHILNEMLLQVDKRLQEIDLHFGEETF